MEEKVIFAPKTVKIKGGEILIRLLREEDGPQLALEEQAQGWGTTTEKFETRMRDFAAGACIPLCAELDGKPVGYVNLYKDRADRLRAQIGRISSILRCWSVCAAGVSARR